MTAQYKEVTETVTRHYAVAWTCDRCHSDMRPSSGWHVQRFTLLFEEGLDYGQDGRNLNGWEVPDLCYSCILFLRTLLETNGFTVVETHRD